MLTRMNSAGPRPLSVVRFKRSFGCILSISRTFQVLPSYRDAGQEGLLVFGGHPARRRRPIGRNKGRVANAGR